MVAAAANAAGGHAGPVQDGDGLAGFLVAERDVQVADPGVVNIQVQAQAGYLPLVWNGQGIADAGRIIIGDA